MKRLDGEWIADYRDISTFPNNYALQLRSSDAEDQKTAFIKSGFSKNPDLKPEVDLKKLSANLVGLKYMTEAIEERETNEIVKAAYIPRLGELSVFLTILQASAKGDTDTFIAGNAEAYGEPKKKELNACLNFFHEFIFRSLENSHPTLRTVALQAQEVLPESSGPQRVWPSQKDFEKVKELYSDFYDGMLEGIEIPEKVKPENAISITEGVLKNLGFDEFEVVEQAKGVTTLSVSQASKKVKIPKEREYTSEEFIGLLGHEVRVHIEERINGENSSLQLLYSGLAKYLRGSEGKGVLTEQTTYQSLDEFRQTRRFFDISRRYLAIALARGTDGVERDFKEVFKIINSIDLLDETAKNPGNLAATATKSVERTWELLAQRVLRGWTGRGAAALKDKVYLEGNLDQWKVLTTQPELFPYLNVGKYDASNSEHVAILQSAGLIPSSLALGSK